MKKIGIYLSIAPHFGGTYQYSLTIIQALKELKSDEYLIYAFFNDKNWFSLLPDTFNKIYIKKSLKWFFGKVYRELDRTENGLTRFASFFNPLLSEVNKSNCDLVIFPNQDFESCASRISSLVSVHDVMHRYNPHFPEYQGNIYNKRERLFRGICNKATGILVDSELGKKQLLESYKVREDKIFVLPFLPPSYLFDKKEINVFEKYYIKTKYIFYPAQFWTHKNHEILLLAYKKLLDEGLNLSLVLVGEKKNNYENVLKMISNLNLPNVKILGYVPNEDMYSLYKNALVTTYVSLLGPTNIPPLEAMWVGCPLIISNIYAMPEQVGDAALLVDPKNPDDIAEKIREILKSENLRNNLIEKGKKRSSQWTQKDFTHRLEQIIKGLISR